MVKGGGRQKRTGGIDPHRSYHVSWPDLAWIDLSIHSLTRTYIPIILHSLHGGYGIPLYRPVLSSRIAPHVPHNNRRRICLSSNTGFDFRNRNQSPQDRQGSHQEGSSYFFAPGEISWDAFLFSLHHAGSRQTYIHTCRLTTETETETKITYSQVH